jgi:hypothetical protein
MKKIHIFNALMLLLLMVCSSISFGRDYFLYDIEKSKILYMGENDTSFAEKIDFEKNPHLIMKTADPNKYLAIYAPEDNSKLPDKKTKESTPGLLIIFNIDTGRTEDLVDLGFWPFRWNYTQDHKHFFITYKPTPDSKSFEMLHYNVEEKESDKLSISASEITDLSFACDESKLYLVANQTINSKKDETVSDLLTITYSPLTIENTMSSDQKILGLYILSQDRIALLNLDWKHKAKSLTLIDAQDNTIVQEQKLKRIYSITSWFEKERILIVAGFETKDTGFGLTGKGQFCKVSTNGIQFTEPSKPWIDFEYIPEKDCLYILSESRLEVIDYKNSISNLCDTGYNIYHDSFYKIYRLPDSNIAAIYCFENSEVKFYDLNENKILKIVNCGRSGVKFLLSFFNVDSKTVITTNQDQSKYFVLNRATKDITVLDQDFNKPNFIVPPEPPVGMYQIKKPILITLITTGKKIYKLNEASSELEPIHEFKEETKATYFYEDENRIIFLSDKELLVINSETLKIENQFFLYGDPNEKYTKLQPGAKRYNFIRAL